MNRTFSKNDTNICKGIAILFMVLHHSVGRYYDSFDLSWYFDNSYDILSLVTVIFSSAGKVCVSLLTILSGYGLSKSFSHYLTDKEKQMKPVRFAFSHIIQFYGILWMIFPFKLIQFFYVFGKNAFSGKAAIGIILNIFGIAKIFKMPVIYDWYVLTIIILYILFPILYAVVKKSPIVALICSIVPWMLRLFIYKETDANKVFFYLLPFVVGVIFEKTNVLDLLYKKRGLRYKIISCVLLVTAFVLRLVFSLYFDVIFAIAIVIFEIQILSGFKNVKKIFVLFGENSANIWLLHTAIIAFLDISMYIKFIIAVISSLLISVILEAIKKRIGYKMLFIRLKRRIY